MFAGQARSLSQNGVPVKSFITLATGQITIDIERPKIDCLSFVYVPAASAAHNRLLFFFILQRPFTELMKKIRAVKQSIFLDVYANNSEQKFNVLFVKKSVEGSKSKITKSIF